MFHIWPLDLIIEYEGLSEFKTSEKKQTEEKHLVSKVSILIAKEMKQLCCDEQSPAEKSYKIWNDQLFINNCVNCWHPALIKKQAYDTSEKKKTEEKHLVSKISF